MAVFMTRDFARFARKARLADRSLSEAAKAVTDGRWDADLGGGVFKQRIARDGAGKSGGFRTIIVFRTGRHSFFVHGFAKNAKTNVTAKELKALKLLAATLLRLDAREIDTARDAGEMIEVVNDGQDDEEN
jgi:hypothetical protein